MFCFEHTTTQNSHKKIQPIDQVQPLKLSSHNSTSYRYSCLFMIQLLNFSWIVVQFEYIVANFLVYSSKQRMFDLKLFNSHNNDHFDRHLQCKEVFLSQQWLFFISLKYFLHLHYKSINKIKLM